MSIELVMPSNHLILCHPLLLLRSGVAKKINIYTKKERKIWRYFILGADSHTWAVLHLYSLIPLKVTPPQLSSHWAPFGLATPGC